MDALTFGSNILLRHMTFSEARKMPIQEFHLDKVLAGLELNKEQVNSTDNKTKTRSLKIIPLLVYRPVHSSGMRLL